MFAKLNCKRYNFKPKLNRWDGFRFKSYAASFYIISLWASWDKPWGFTGPDDLLVLTLILVQSEMWGEAAVARRRGGGGVVESAAPARYAQPSPWSSLVSWQPFQPGRRSLSPALSIHALTSLTFMRRRRHFNTSPSTTTTPKKTLFSTNRLHRGPAC